MKKTNDHWVDHPSNPLIKPPFPEWLIADPTVLSAADAPDGKWHLFAHGLIGIYHYHSYDGIHWQKVRGVVSFLSLRPFIYHEKKEYFLIYEKLNAPFNFPFYNSHLEIKRSTDLVHWGQSRILLRPRFPWHKTKNKIGNLGNPSLVKVGGRYRLYYSSGLVQFPDTFFCEPGFQAIATARKITGPYIPQKKPFLRKVSVSSKFKSATRVSSISKGFLGLQTFFRTDPFSHLSSSALHFSFSKDGLRWKTDKKPAIIPGIPWKKTHVYVGALIKNLNRGKRIYYNARDGHGILSKETIGLATSK